MAAGMAVVVAVAGGRWVLGRKGTKGNTKPAVAVKADGGADTLYTLEELAQYDGVVNKGSPILIGVDGTVFDMTIGKDFYGPGGPYEAFAGRCVYPLAASDQTASAFALPPAAAVLDSRSRRLLNPRSGFEGGAAHRDATVALAKMKVDREFTNVPDGMAGLSLSEKDILNDWKTVCASQTLTRTTICRPNSPAGGGSVQRQRTRRTMIVHWPLTRVRLGCRMGGTSRSSRANTPWWASWWVSP